MTVFLTTQYLEEADVLADRVGIIDHGRIVAEGTPAALKAEIGAPDGRGRPRRPGRTRRRRRGARAASATPRAASPEGVAVRLRRRAPTWPRSCARSTPRASTIAHLQLHEPTLDDVFLAKTGRSLEGAGDEDEEPAGEPAEVAGVIAPAARRRSALLARRSVVRTLRQPAMIVPVARLPAVAAGGELERPRARRRSIPGFPTDSYLTFALAIPFMQGALFAAMSAGTNVAATSRPAS